MSIPRILVIDDQSGSNADTRGQFCAKCNTVEIDITTSDEELNRLAGETKPLAGMFFSSGQTAHGGRVENSIDEVLRVVGAGWPSSEGWRWALILVDLRFDSMPATDQDGTFGFKILENLVRVYPDLEAQPGNSELPIIMLSRENRADSEESASIKGALAFVEKDEMDRKHLESSLRQHGLIEDSRRDVLGRSHALLRFLRSARRVARFQSGNVLILGSPGSGKTTLARYIHAESGRLGGCFEHVCKPGSENLEPNELFGCWKGAFNEAQDSPGKAELAHNGTLLIDEVHTLSGMSQESFYQFARLKNGSREVRRMGNFPNTSAASNSVKGKLNKQTGVIEVDVLVLAASSEPLDDPDWRLKNGFKYPFYTRLATEYGSGPLHLPTMAQRRDDIPVIFEELVNRATEENDGRLGEHGRKLIEPEVMSWVKEYDWPGNIPQLAGTATTVALNALHFPTVRMRHLPLDTSSSWNIAVISDNPDPVPSRISPLPKSSEISFEKAVSALEVAQIPHTRKELSESLAKLQKAYAELVKNVLEVALGKINEEERLQNRKASICLPAMKLVFGKEIKSAGQAYAKLRKLDKLFKQNPPDSDSALARAIQHARLKGGRDTGDLDHSDLDDLN